MKKVLLLLLLVSAFGIMAVNAQETVPVNYQLKKTEDFKLYEPNVIKSISWLASISRSEFPEKRQATEDFLVEWIKGCPYVQVIIESYIMKLSKKNPDLLLSFMFGYTLYELQHTKDKIILDANLAGLDNLIKDYTMNAAALKEDEQIEKVMEMKKNGKLADWVKQRLTVLSPPDYTP